jgi:hypothetical protein
MAAPPPGRTSQPTADIISRALSLCCEEEEKESRERKKKRKMK